MNRRGFLKGILAAGIAPAVCKARILMPVKRIVVPPLIAFVPPSLFTGEVGLFYGVRIITSSGPSVRGEALEVSRAQGSQLLLAMMARADLA